MGKWKTKELREAPSPQPWKMNLSGQLDLLEEFDVKDDPTGEFRITEPDDFMEELAFEQEDTEVYERKNNE